MYNTMIRSCFFANCTLSYWASAKFVFFLLVLPVNLLSSQTLLEKNSSCILESGVRVKNQLSYSNDNDALKGQNVLWDFSNWEPKSQSFTSKYFDTGLNSMSKYEHRTFYNYKLKDDTLFLCGYKNYTANVSYLLPEVSLIYPLVYGDSTSNYFYGVGNYSNHTDLRVYGKKNVSIDAFGALILPSGDTVSNVIRVHSEKVMQYQFDSGVSLKLDSLSIPSIDSIAKCLNSSLDLIKMDVFEWYMEGYCKPIFETVRNTIYESGKPYKYFSTAFCCPIEEMRYINIDNIKAQLGNRSEKTHFNDGQSDEIYSFNSFFEEESRSILLEYNSIEGATVDVMLFDVQGRLLFHDKSQERHSGKYTLSIDISQYRMTEFIVRLSVNEKVYSKKVFIK